MVHLSALLLAVLLIIIYVHYELTVNEKIEAMTEVYNSFN